MTRLPDSKCEHSSRDVETANAIDGKNQQQRGGRNIKSMNRDLALFQEDCFRMMITSTRLYLDVRQQGTIRSNCRLAYPTADRPPCVVNCEDKRVDGSDSILNYHATLVDDCPLRKW